jgi:hypothetical protein
MSLGNDQRLFAKLVGEFITWIYSQGYEVTLGDAYRDPRVHGQYGERTGYGAPKSFHKKRLAIDLNLFRNGKYLTETEDHKPLGDKWKTMHPDCVWGGDFTRPDGNHYSFGESR